MFETLLILFVIIFVIGSIFFLINTEKQENSRSIYLTIFMVVLLSVCWYTAYISFNSERPRVFTSRLVNLGTNLLLPILLYIIHKIIPQKLKKDYFLYMILFMISASVVIAISALAVIKAQLN